MRGDGRENVTPVECAAHRFQEITLVGYMPDPGLFVSEDDGEHAVVRRDKELAGHLGQNRSARGTDARIDHHDMDASFGEIAIGLRDAECAIGNLEGLHVVGDIDDLGSWLDAQDHALHGAGKVIGCSEVGGKSDDPLWQGVNLPDVSASGGGKSNPEWEDLEVDLNEWLAVRRAPGFRAVASLLQRFSVIARV